jgi:hypothetical protein
VSSTLAGVFGIAALFVAVLALVFAIQALRAQSGTPKAGPKAAKLPATPTAQSQQQQQAQPAQTQTQAQAQYDPKPSSIKSELRRLSQEIEEARGEIRETLQHLAVVRYDAYGDMGGRLSWSMALLDDNGDGVVLSSINNRNDSRSYAKEVKAFETESKLSPEEEEAIETLRKEASPALGDPNHQ